jgi:hypothetical protein
MALATTVALPIVRGPVALAKSLAAIDLLSGGRLVVGVGPGSSARDYAAAGIPFEERWKRLEEAVLAMRALWLREGSPFKGEFYSTEGVVLEPHGEGRHVVHEEVGEMLGRHHDQRVVRRLAHGELPQPRLLLVELLQPFFDQRSRLVENISEAPKKTTRVQSTVSRSTGRHHTHG